MENADLAGPDIAKADDDDDDDGLSENENSISYRISLPPCPRVRRGHGPQWVCRLLDPGSCSSGKVKNNGDCSVELS